jgi:hypothetical protein
MQNIKTLVVLFLFVFLPFAGADSRELLKYVPQNSFFLTGADFDALRNNEIYTSLEQSGKIWSKNEDSDLPYFKQLNLSPERDVRSFLFSRYLNAYGSKGDIRIFTLNRDISGLLAAKSSTKYLSASLYRLDPDLDWYAVVLGPSTVAFGDLAEVKTAVDLLNSKLPSVNKNAELSGLLTKIPEQAAVWGAALPLTRKQASDSKADQSTSVVLQAFRNYYFYGIPSKNEGNVHFIGETVDDKEAVFANTFLIGLLTFAKVRAPENIAEQLDNVQVDRKERNIHVSGKITKQMVDAYFKGQLGVK